MNSDRNRGGSSNDSLRGGSVERANRVGELDETWPSPEPQGDGEPYTDAGRSGGGSGENNDKERDSPQGRATARPSAPATSAKAVPEKARSSRRSS